MIEITTKISLTPGQLAREFVGMDSGDQAKFFSCVDQERNAWRGESLFIFQLQSISDSEHLTDGGRRVMELIGEYARKSEG